jgi:hypothetical protein
LFLLERSLYYTFITPDELMTGIKVVRDLVPDISKLPDDALLSDRQNSAITGFTVDAFKKWRREGRGPATIYVEGRPRTTVKAFREWINSGRRVSA